MTKSIFLMMGLGIAATANAASVAISSMKELADFAAKSGNSVTTKPGIYQMADLLTDELVTEKRNEAIAAGKRPRVCMFSFSGSSNHFDLTGVTIEVDTRFLSAFKGCYVVEFLIPGSRNTIQGLAITDVGNLPTDRGGNSLSVFGDNNTLNNLTLNVRGSFPYGYGDLLGKGGPNLVTLKKHSGLMISGTNTKLLGCKVITRSFGHAFYIQGGINTYFENCYAEGEMRSTDDMLAETSGPAFEKDFKSVYPPNAIQPGYMKSLSECGFRTYDFGGPDGRKTGAVKLVNCTAKNVRVGFALGANEKTNPVELIGCTAIGCERSYTLEKAVVKNCLGDAKYGPLLYLSGGGPSKIDLTLLSETSEMNVHAVATICGNGHVVSIKGSRDKEHPIMLGYCSPGGGENSAPIGKKEAEKITLVNATTMPLIVGAKARKCTVSTAGAVVRNDGENIKINRTEIRHDNPHFPP